MRYSRSKRLSITEIPVESRRGGRGNAAFFDAVAKDTSAEDRRLGVLFVGGESHADIAVRQAQSLLRFDRLPSLWSHAALILEWPDRAGAAGVIGAEVALQPAAGEDQLPERNGVTLFSLDRYLDAERWPNLAFGTLDAAPPTARARHDGDGPAANPLAAKDIAALKGRMHAAALDPCREVTRFALFRWLGDWHRFVFAGGENPLSARVPHPGAAFCEYVYEAAGLNLTPGATEPNACPEILWSTLLYWHGCLADGGLSAWASYRKDAAPNRTPAPKDLTADLKRRARQATPAAARKPRRRK